MVVCKVYDLSGKYLSEYRKTGETIKKEVNSNGIYQNGEVTYNESDCIYGGEPTGIGSSQGAQFKCKDSTGVVPRTSLTQVDFGANDQSLLADAPGNFNYDTKGGLAGFVAGYNLSGIPCSVYYLGGVFGIPSNFACRIKGGFAGALAGNKLGDYIYNISNQNNAQNSNTSNSTSPVNTADVIMPKLKGEVELGSECNVSSDCQSGYCAPPVLNFLPQRCESPNKHFSKQVSDGGKYLEGITCKDNNQCEEGLYCMQRFIGSNTCESKTNITLKSGDKCPLTLTFGEEQSCAHCPDGYGVSEGKSYCK